MNNLIKICGILLLFSAGSTAYADVVKTENNEQVVASENKKENTTLSNKRFLSNNKSNPIVNKDNVHPVDYLVISPTGEVKEPVQEKIKNSDLILHSDNLLSQQIKEWSSSQGYKLIWKSKKDYLIYNDIHIKGNESRDVLDKLGNLLASQDYSFNIKLFKNNNVLVIEEN